jgi:toxin-antitoxin system PIN domain toxin
VSSTRTRYLLDLNVLIALGDPDHKHHGMVQKWFMASGREDWGVCPLTEAGFVRLRTNPAYLGAGRTVEQATAILTGFAKHSGYRYWPITESWASLVPPFAARIFGHQQVTDAYLLGLAAKENGVLVTLDRAMSYLAGAQYRHNLLVLE